MDWLTLSVAVAGLAISATLAGLKIWETFFSRPRFDISFKWFDASDVELELSFTLSNVGHRAASIHSVSIVSESGEAFQGAEIARQLPIHLEPGESSRPFTINVRTDVAYDPGTSLFIGKGRILVTDSRGRNHEYTVPNPYDAGILGWVDDPPAPGGE